MPSDSDHLAALIEMVRDPEPGHWFFAMRPSLATRLCQGRRLMVALRWLRKTIAPEITDPQQLEWLSAKMASLGPPQRAISFLCGLMREESHAPESQTPGLPTHPEDRILAKLDELDDTCMEICRFLTAGRDWQAIFQMLRETHIQ